MQQHTFILDQGEFIGGAERFMLDFLQSLKPAEARKINPIVIGGKCTKYRTTLQECQRAIECLNFEYPPVRGNSLQKVMHTSRLTMAARQLKKMVKPYGGSNTFISNTPRTHFVMYLAKKVWGIKGNWVAIVHDFTTPPFLMKRVAKHCDTLVANALPTRNYLHDFLPESDKKKIQIIENGVDMQTIPKLRPIETVEKILMLGRIDPRKGQMFALEAADLLLERNQNIRFSIVGDSVVSDPRTIEYEKKLRNFVRDRSLTNVNFESSIPSALERINEADLVLMLQTEPETFGRVAIEALALGKMVVTFDETGPKEILESFLQYLSRQKNINVPREHFIVEAHNAMSLAECIGHWADHPAKAYELSKHAHQYVEENYNLTETTKRMINLCSHRA